MIRTVSGDVEALKGRILTHEHLQIDLSATKGNHVVLNENDYADIKEDIDYVKALGFGAIVDVTAPEAGRNTEVIARISRETGVVIICSTGFYWEPQSSFAVHNSVPDMQQRLVDELTIGINGGGVRAGVIKVGNNKNAPYRIDEKIFEAAAGASKVTGAPIITHTSHPEQALWQLDVLQKHGADIRHVLIGHLDRADERLLKKVASYGSFFGIDKIGYSWQKPDEGRADLVKFAVDCGFTPQIILSSDMARKERLRRYGGDSYATTPERFIPLLKERGLDEGIIETILHDNPRRLLQWSSASAL